MLDEAIEIIRELWKGDEVSFDGDHFAVENARIYDAPTEAIPVVVSAFGPKAAELRAYRRRPVDHRRTAVRLGRPVEGRRWSWPDLLPDRHLLEPGSATPALDAVEHVWRTAGVPGQLMQDLPTPAHFDTAASLVRRDDLADSVIVGADEERLVDEVRAAAETGVDHLYFHQIGDEQEAFCDAWTGGLSSRLAEVVQE